MNKTLRYAGFIGLVVIVAASAAIIFGMVDNSIRSVSSTDSFITAFGGAFFAYIFVKMGELGTRLSLREKLNKDTIVRVQYTLNDHLNRIDTNLHVADTMLKAIKAKTKAVSLSKFKPIPYDSSNLPDMKNLDFINDVFNYYADLDKINDDLALIQDFARYIIEDYYRSYDSVPSFTSGVDSVHAMMQTGSIESFYESNAKVLSDQIEEVKKFLKEAEKDCVTLVAKAEFVLRHRSVWLSPAVPWFNATHYNAKKLVDELPELTAKFEKSRDENTRDSRAKINTVLDDES